MSPHVDHEYLFRYSCVRTYRARERTSANVTHVMFMINARVVEFFATDCTEYMFPLMFFSLMARQFADAQTSKIAGITFEFLRWAMSHHVTLKEVRRGSLIAAFLASKRPFASVRANMILQEAHTDVRIVAKWTEEFVHDIVLRFNVSIERILSKVAICAMAASERSRLGVHVRVLLQSPFLSVQTTARRTRESV